MSKPLILSVYKEEDVAIFDIPEMASIARYEKLDLDPNLFRQISHEINKIARRSTCSQLAPLQTSNKKQDSAGTTATKELIKLGRMVFEQLFPIGTQNALKNSQEKYLILRLDEALLEIPWELAHDGNAFIGNRFHVGRQILSSQSLVNNQKSIIKDEKPEINVLIISDPTGTLPEVETETRILLDLLDQHNEFSVEVIGGERAGKFQILKALEEFDIVHFAGHSVYASESIKETGWKLCDGVIGPEEIRRLSNPPRLVFSNSCASATVRNFQKQNNGTSNNQVSNFAQIQLGNLGIGGSFLMAGVQNYVGSLWVIHDNSSADFAKYFYVDLLAGSTIGNALWAAKNQSMTSHPVQTFIWASYVHYGDPQYRAIVPKDKKTKAANKISKDYAHKHIPISRFFSRRSILVVLLLIFFLAAGYWLSSFRIQGPKIVNNQRNLLIDLYEQAVSDYKAGRIEQALGAFQHLSNRSDNPNGIGLANLAEIYSEAGLNEQANAMLKQALEINPVNAMAHILLGERYLGDKEIKRAVKAYHQALNAPGLLDSQAARALNALGVIAFVTGDTKKSESYFNNALSKYKNNAAAFFNLGVVAFYRRDFTDAAIFFRKVLEQSSNDELALIFSQIVPEKDNSHRNNSDKAIKIVSVGPFIQKRGVIRRIGVDILLAEALVSMHTESIDWHFQFTPYIYGTDYYEFRPNTLAGNLKLTKLFQTSGYDIAVFGQYSLTEHILTLTLKMTDVKTGEIYLNNAFREEGNKKMEKIIHNIKTIISQKISDIRRQNLK